MSKQINFSFSGGFPFGEETLGKMQEQYVEYFKALCAFIGLSDVGNYILTGVEVTGTSISSGWVYMDGDVMPFAALTGTTGLTTKFKKQTIAENRDFFSGPSHPVYITTSIIQDTTGVELSTFQRIPNIPVLPDNMVLDPADLTTTPPQKTVLERITELEKKTSIFTTGGVVFPWRKKLSEIPAGFQEVTDLRGKTVFGMDINVDPTTGAYINPEFAPLTTGQNDPKRNGGSKTVTLVKANLPNIPIDTTKHGNKVAGDAMGNDVLYLDTSGVNIGGSSTPVEVLPPFQTVIFIEYIG
jgi:hypothetical protein